MTRSAESARLGYPPNDRTDSEPGFARGVDAAVLTYVARQPIFDRRLDVVGYELLYRGDASNVADVVDQEAATFAVLGNALVDFGLETLVGTHPAFINVPRSFFDDGKYRLVQAKQVVLELLEGTTVDEELIEAIRGARAEGYRVALDDFTGQDTGWSLVDQAEIVKVDLRAIDTRQVADQARALKTAGVTILAEKVETYQDLELCRSLGFDLFQGFFFERPIVLSRAALSPDRLAATQLLVELHDPDVDVRRVAEVIRRDVGLTFRLLGIVNSSFYGLRNQVESVVQAVGLLGLDTVRNFASVIALMKVQGKPSELMTTAMVRARMCEILATRRSASETDGAFMVGLLSVLEALMDAPLAHVVERLPLSERVESALLAGEGPLGDLLNLVRAYERGDQATLATSGLAPDLLTGAYIEAVAWARDVRSALPVPGRATGPAA